MELTEAKKLIEILADGIDPFTGEIFEEDHICNNVQIVRALHAVLKSCPPEKPHKQKPENAGVPWTEEDDMQLADLFDDDHSIADICTILERSRGSIAARLVRIGKIEDRKDVRKR